MFVQIKELRSGLGRKFFILVFLAALLPMLLFASFSYNYVGNALLQESRANLQKEARFYSTILYERLLLVSSQVAASYRAQTTTVAEGGLEFSPYKRLQRLEWSELEYHLQHLSMRDQLQARERLVRGMRVLLTNPDGHAILLQPDTGDDGLYLADLDVGYLLGESDNRNPELNYCVFGSDAVPLYCSRAHEISRSGFQQMIRDQGNRSNFQLDWEDGDAIQQVSVRSVFLENQFGVNQAWRLWVSHPRADVFQTLNILQRVLSLLVAVTVLLAALVSVLQIGRILRPLRQLMDATHAVANRNFEVSLSIPTRDELGDLAEAFNQMAHQIGKQFQLLTGLSKIDQLILSVPDLDQVAQSTLSTLHELVSSDAAAVALRNPDNVDEMWVFHYAKATGQYQMQQQTLGDDESHWLGVLPASHKASATDAKYLGWLWSEREEVLNGSSYLFPIMAAGKNRGVLALGWSTSHTLPEQDRGLLKDFADRLAVAITAVRREKKLYRQAHFDPLTQLPNRQLMKDRLDQAIKHATRNNSAGAILFVDLDKFQQVNDTDGHSLGDQILIRTAERLQVCVTMEDTVARQGGDEFVIVLNNIDTPMRATRVADKIITMLGSPFTIEGKKHFLNGSIGIAVFPSDGMDVDTLLRKADTAMHRAKAEGGGQYRYFEEEMNRASQRRVTAEHRIRNALDGKQVELRYQPQWFLQRNEFSVEALVRIRDAEAGLLCPADFIDVAEDTGLILDVGEWVLREACQQMARWRMDNLNVKRVSVNVSGRQLERMDFVSVVQEAVDSANLDYTDLELEVTESILIVDSESAARKLGQLSDLGVTIAIDDFGTGYSSLSYLHRLPFDLVKIDQQFVAGIGLNKASEAITRSVVDLAKSFNKQVIAEGVETREQLELLRSIGCDAMQGYLLSRPLTADKVSAFLKQVRSEPELT
ncbi:MAG: EAL domain-containing protein [Pseudomonadota bacterium]|nr:EAL domain-containing protein [Pseudomonadota bacterium]